MGLKGIYGEGGRGREVKEGREGEGRKRGTSLAEMGVKAPIYVDSQNDVETYRWYVSTGMREAAGVNWVGVQYPDRPKSTAIPQNHVETYRWYVSTGMRGEAGEIGRVIGTPIAPLAHPVLLLTSAIALTLFGFPVGIPFPPATGDKIRQHMGRHRHQQIIRPDGTDTQHATNDGRP